jgi:hypothetical protein
VGGDAGASDRRNDEKSFAAEKIEAGTSAISTRFIAVYDLTALDFPNVVGIVKA